MVIKLSNRQDFLILLIIQREMRSKENSDDYRYFPDPDIPSIIISKELIDSVSKQMPMLPAQVRESLVASFGMSDESLTSLHQKRIT